MDAAFSKSSIVMLTYTCQSNGATVLHPPCLLCLTQCAPNDPEKVQQSQRQAIKHQRLDCLCQPSRALWKVCKCLRCSRILHSYTQLPVSVDIGVQMPPLSCGGQCRQRFVAFPAYGDHCVVVHIPRSHKFCLLGISCLVIDTVTYYLDRLEVSPCSTWP